MTVIKNKKDAEKFVREFEQVVPAPEEMYKEIAIRIRFDEEKQQEVREILHYDPIKDAFYIETRDRLYDDIVHERSMKYLPHVVELVWENRKQINNQLKKLKEVTV